MPGTRTAVRRGRAVLLWTALIAAFSGAWTPAPQEKKRDEVPEYVLKAGFLYNFAKYVEWPPEAFEKPDSPILIGVVGKDPFGPVLEETLKDKTVNDRKFEVRRFPEPDDIEYCHILFVPRTEKEHVPDILKRVESRNVLTVGEDEGFAADGGILNILIVEERPKLEANPEAAERAGLKINSKLLNLAVIVKEEE